MTEKKSIKIDLQSVIDSQIKQFYSVIAQERDNRVKVRNWAITIWLAYIAILGSGKISVNHLTSLLILWTIIAIFWTIEGFHQSLVIVNEIRVRKLEELLSQENLPESLSLDLFYDSGYSKITFKEKGNAFLLACFTGEPIVFFNLAMILGSILFIYFGGLPEPVTQQTITK